MNKPVVGSLGAVILIACGWLALGANADSRADKQGAVAKESRGPEARARATLAHEAPERENAEPARSADADDASQEVSRVVNAGVVDALGDAKMRLRDQAAERELLRQTPMKPPNGPELPTAEELKKIREIRRAYGDHDQDETENTNEQEPTQ
jgi:hypothetical protein